MKKYLFVISALFVFVACTESIDEPELKYEAVGLTDKIKISDIETIYSDITELALVARFHVPAGVSQNSTLDANGKDTRVMLKVPFAADGTTVLLPDNPPQELLNGITSDFPAGLEISDPEAKTIAFVELACNISDQNNFSYTLERDMKTEEARFILTYIYCDRPVTITGTSDSWRSLPTSYNLGLQKGWNIVIEKQEYNGEQGCSITHLMPEGMKWIQNMWVGGR